MLEFCAENFTHLPSAFTRGADRFELCDNLAVGGTTVSYGVMLEAAEFCAEHRCGVRALLRPRGGDFHYDERERKIILTDAAIMQKIKNLDGIVCGALTAAREIDAAFLEAINAVNDKPKTFHMAFDLIPLDRQLAAIKQLMKLNYDKILAHGYAIKRDIMLNIEQLRRLSVYLLDAGMTLIVGGGVNWQNLSRLQELLPRADFHGTRIVSFDSVAERKD